MAQNKNSREIQFTLNDDDYKAFGRYRIMYTDQGKKMVGRHRATFLISAVMLAVLFTIFKVDFKFTILVYIVAGLLAIVGIFFSEKLVVRQQDKAIEADANSAERVHAVENKIKFGNDEFVTYAGDDEQTFSYKDIHLVDLAETAIYVWMSETMIMPLPLHAFRNMAEMKEFCKWIRAKKEEAEAAQA